MSEEPKKESKLPGFKVVVGTVGAVFAVAHIGLLGYVVRRPEPPRVPQVPTINIPSGDYSSYKLKATKDGYEIEYKANDPAILESSKSLTLDKEKKGLFGGGTEKRTEFRRDQFTMDGTRNIGGNVSDAEGKSNAKSAECIAEDAGARSQGCLLYTSPSPRDATLSRMPSSA